MKKQILILITLLFSLNVNLFAEDESKFYGFVLFNTAYNTKAPSPVDIPVKATGGEEGSLIMTARQSRFGFKFSKTTGDYKIGGKVELDLWGLMGSANSGGVTQSAPRTRLAYFFMDINKNASLLFGQYWAVFAPLHPSSLAHVSIPEFSGSGNLWNRLPQARFTYSNDQMIFQAAVVRPFAADVKPAITQSDYLGAGEYSKLPFLQGRAGLKLNKSMIAVSGHFGQLDYRNENLDDPKTTSVAGAVDAKLVFGKVTLSGEGFFSKNNKVLFGLAGPAVPDSGSISDAESVGGWGQLSVALSPQLKLNGGFGLEDVTDGITNTTFFANLMHSLKDTPLTFGIELTNITTKPSVDTADFTNLTVNFAAKCGF